MVVFSVGTVVRWDPGPSDVVLAIFHRLARAILMSLTECVEQFNVVRPSPDICRHRGEPAKYCGRLPSRLLPTNPGPAVGG